MEPRTAAPREHLTAEQVDALITGPRVRFRAGCELLVNGAWVDISDDLVRAGSSIEWDNRTDVNGSCQLNFLRPFAWGRDRVRPFIVLSDDTVEARFNRPVFVLNRPEENRGPETVTYTCRGDDLLSLLKRTGPGETHVAVANGVLTYRQAIQAALNLSPLPDVTLQVDGTAIDTVIPATLVWALISPAPSWLRILTDLFKDIGYDSPWIDAGINLRARQHQDVSARTPEFELNTRDPRIDITDPDRTVSTDTEEPANTWRFWAANATVTPTIGNGLIYEPPVNQSVGPNSIDAIGEVFKGMPLDAATPAALVAMGNKIRAEDMGSVVTYTVKIHPLPIMGKDDVFNFTDIGDPVKVAAASCTENLDGSPGRLVLGGEPALVAPSVEQQAQATVTSAAPLRVVVDGALVDSFANTLNSETYTIGQRVNVTVRNPRPPLVLGAES